METASSGRKRDGHRCRSEPVVQKDEAGDSWSKVLWVYNHCVFVLYVMGVAVLLPLIIVNAGFKVSLYSAWIAFGIVACSWSFGKILEIFVPLAPAFLPQLVIGILTRILLINKVKSSSNKTGSIDLGDTNFHEAFQSTSSTIRDIAVAVLTMRIGFGFDLDALRQTDRATKGLILLPLNTEVLTCCGSAFVLLGWKLSVVHSMLWGAMLGCVLGAVAARVIVTSVVYLHRNGLLVNRVQRQIVSMLMTASSFDDVFAICLFEFILSITIIADGPTTGVDAIWTYSKSPTFYITGACGSFILGRMICGAMSQSGTFSIIVAISLPFILHRGAIVLNISPAGPIACIVFGITVARQTPGIYADLGKCLDTLWIILEPAMYGLLGCAVDFSNIEINHLLKLVTLLMSCLLLRTSVALAVAKKDFTKKQAAYISLAWMPSATIQAAMGGTALSRLSSIKDKTTTSYSSQVKAATDILTMSVLCILISVPIGMATMRLSAKKLLYMPSDSQEERIKRKERKKKEAVMPKYTMQFRQIEQQMEGFLKLEASDDEDINP